MAHWLMKSEPESYSWDDLVRDGGTEWDGVRNNAARLHLRAMKPGGLLYFSTNSRRFKLDQEQIKASAIKDITRQTTPFDFEGKLFRWCYLLTK